MLQYEPTWPSDNGIGRLVQRIFQRTSSSGLAAAIVRQAGSSSSIQFIGARGIPLNVLEAYAGKNLFYQDPFLGFAATESQSQFRYSVLDALEVDPRRQAGTDYLDFMQYHGVNIVGVGIRPLRNDIFLSVCFHAEEGAEETSSLLTNASEDIEILLAEIGLEILGKTLAELPSAPASQMSKICAASVSDNDQKVINFVVSGLMNKQIAFELNVTEDAIENRLRRIYRKFDVHNRASLIGKVIHSAPTRQ